MLLSLNFATAGGFLATVAGPMRLCAVTLLSLFAAETSSQRRCPLPVASVYQGGQASGAFSSICYLGGDRMIAGKRSTSAGNRFVLRAMTLTREARTLPVVRAPSEVEDGIVAWLG